ncbi:L-threonine-O-3-phosphate decarboxylase [Clostridium botulinum]|uniref:L-threonine-O-3-phosphate decarboxylase n=1 Tax=Clostridium botulinum TaxID=1491 RepID=A0A9Q1UWZ7_CLOBO|nr:histidinol-phosphate transaminase [Clostridium botulinum]AEB76064.1 L-threonine-O-3-phosphate decarboxylase, putative [Clostridium botulinum BKT015925]KEI02411.1 L-threonine-O-3-phosphate decarboxylase [Clostridium botulinum D str. 16868]KEI04119.1 L-threonine-O-3-phosphate decarboxylase [Clostridium botulinum C/D str. Sp77]KLU76951.1 L-threonine-O-3-phosphate decarboxylase [Clostridium botulinum V891]KOA76328.1 L-threonine-O-3-phosphate decarboxylase [Clostridium botulinum]
MNFHGGDIYSVKSNNILDFSSNINPLGVPESFKNALIENINDFIRYPDIKYTELKNTIKDYIGIDSIEHIVQGNGAVEIIYKAIGAVKCNKAYIVSPTFSEYRRAVELNNVKCEEIDVFDQEYMSIDIEKLLHKVEKNSLVIVCNPNNPTGSLIKRDTMIELLEKLKVIKSTLIIDEAFIEFTPNSDENTMIPLISRYNNLIIVRAATKFFGMPGIRLGYGVTGNMEYINNIKEKLEPWNINTAAVIAGNTIFKDKDYIKKSKEWIGVEREFLYNELNKFEELKVYKSNANFHLLKINKSSMNAYELKDMLVKEGILIRVPKGFYNLSDMHFRLAIKDRTSNKVLISKLKNIFK